MLHCLAACRHRSDGHARTNSYLSRAIVPTEIALLDRAAPVMNCSSLNSSTPSFSPSSYSNDPIFFVSVIDAPMHRNIFAWFMTVLVPMMGVATNAVVVFIGVSVRLQKSGDFKYFLTTMAIVDILWCISILLYRPYFTADACTDEYNVYALAPVPSLLRVPVRYMWMSTQVAMGFPLVLLSINRYLLLCRSQKAYRTVFDGWKTPLLCAASLPLGAAINAPYLFDTTRYVKASLAEEFEQYVESYVTSNGMNRARVALIMIVLLFYYVVVLSCTLGVFLKLNTHSRQSLSQADERRLRENRAILRAILIQTVLPFFISLPTFVDLLAAKSTEHNWWLRACTEWTLHLNPLCDALVTLYIIRPYRRVVGSWCKKLFDRSDRVDSSSREKLEMITCGMESHEVVQKLSVTTLLGETMNESVRAMNE